MLAAVIQEEDLARAGPVSVEEVRELIRHERELNEERIRRLDAEIAHIRELGDAQRTADQLALETALTASKEMLEAHNGLLRKIEKLTETFATKEQVAALESSLAWARGFIGAIGIVGVANFVKVWTGG